MGRGNGIEKGYWYVLVTTLLFSSMEIALKSIAGQFNPVQLNFSRFLVGGIFLLPLRCGRCAARLR